MKLPQPQSAAFSLIELLIVMALVLILTVLMWGRGSGSRQRQDKKTCAENLQTLFVSMQIFANDHASAFPSNSTATSSDEALGVLVPRYTSVTKHFICPGSKDSPLPEGEPIERRRISYAYYMGRLMLETTNALLSDAQVNAAAKAEGERVFSADGKGPGSNHDKFGGNILFGDGHAETIPTKTPMALPLRPGVVLLNPRP